MKATISLFLICLAAVSAAASAAAPSYAVVDLGVAQAVAGINNQGEVLAYDQGGNVLLFIKNGWVRNLNLLPTLLSTCSFSASDHPVFLSADGINDHGAVVLTAQPQHDPFSNCVAIYANNALQFQTTLGEGGFATGINNAGQIIGELTDAPGVVGFGPVCDFIRAGNFISAEAINDNEQIAGNGSSGAELCSNATWQVIPAIPGSSLLFARAINNKGEVVGDADVAGGVRSFLYGNGKTQDLGALPGATFTSAQSINARSQIVGATVTASGPGTFLYAGGEIFDLLTLIGATDPYKFLVSAFTGSAQINDFGVIATTGTDFGGASHIYLLTPIKP